MYAGDRIEASWFAPHPEAEDRFRNIAERIFGHPVEPIDVAHLVGVPDGSLVHVEAQSDVEIKVDSYSREHGVRMVRGFHRDEHGLCAWHYRMRVSPSGDGKGFAVFSKTVERYQEANVRRIELIAARDDRPDPHFQNGYRVWASFGFCLFFEEPILESLRGTPFEGATDSHELFAIDGGAVWWFVNGDSSYGVFEVNANSRHNEMLDAYRAIKQESQNA